MSATGPDRAAAVRRALRELVAQRGFHGASMTAVARAARVATGTTYTHYPSKHELVLATYIETKAELAAAATADLGDAAEPEQRFRSIWLATYRYLAANRDHAIFLLQVDCSPYRAEAHRAALSGGADALMAQAIAPDVAARLLELPLEVLYELGLAPAVRLAADGAELGDEALRTIAGACWRAVSRPESASTMSGAEADERR